MRLLVLVPIAILLAGPNPGPALVNAPALADAQRATALYLGNEGVMVSQGPAKILFDPLFEEDFGGTYTLVPTEMLVALAAGRAPYDGVGAVFISHIHPDHFSSGRIIAYLRAHPNVRLFSTREVYDAIQAAGVRAGDPLLSRIQSIEARAGDPPRNFTYGSFRVEAYPVSHVGRPLLQHLAFRVTFAGGMTVMHLGDAAAGDSFYAPYQAAFDGAPLDTLFAPAWLLTNPASSQMLETRLKPRLIIGIHATKSTPSEISSGGPHVFKTPGETRGIGR